MSIADFQPIIDAIMAAAFAAIAGMIGVYVPRLVAAFETRTGIALTAQQQATVLGAAQTAAGILQTKIDQGILKIQHINSNDPTVEAEAAAALARVPDAATALHKDVPSMVATVIGLVDTTPKPPVVSLPQVVIPGVPA